MIEILRRGAWDDKDEEAAAASLFTLRRTVASIPVGSRVVARYCALPFYNWLDEEVEAHGSRLINSLAQHRYIADIWQWYHDLRDVTFETWPAQHVPSHETGPFVVKGETNSMKRLFKTHMYAENRAALTAVVNRLYNDTWVGVQPLYVRKFVPLRTFHLDVVGMPVTNEYRLFVLDGKVIGSGFYWASHVEDLEGQDLDPAQVPSDLIRYVVDTVKVPFFVMDVAETATGEWKLVELNDAQMSGLSCVDAKALYLSLLRG